MGTRTAEESLILGILFLWLITRLITGEEIEVPEEVIEECFRRLDGG